MSFTARPVVSGKPYAIVEVRGHVPAGLADFAGDTTFLLDLDGEDYRVWGPGVRDGGLVRVYEKSDDGLGKDVRVWLVHAVPDSTLFTATHLGVDVPAQVARDVDV